MHNHWQEPLLLHSHQVLQGRVVATQRAPADFYYYRPIGKGVLSRRNVTIRARPACYTTRRRVVADGPLTGAARVWTHNSKVSLRSAAEGGPGPSLDYLSYGCESSSIQLPKGSWR